MKVLIVDDEKQLAKAIVCYLNKNKIEADTVDNGDDGLYYGLTGVYDVIVLDIMLPKLDGYQVLSLLRKDGISTPVLFLSAKGTTDDRIKGLDVGADDYLAKPFDLGELLARIKALARRKQEFVGDDLKFGDISVSRNSYELTVGDKKILLGLKEFSILEYLIIDQNQYLSKDMIIEKVWGYDADTEYNNVEVYISFIRKKLEALGSKVVIKAHRGVGYKLEIQS